MHLFSTVVWNTIGVACIVGILLCAFGMIDHAIQSRPIKLGKMREELKKYAFPDNPPEDFVRMYRLLLHNFGKAICEEKIIWRSQAEKLPPETEFRSEEVRNAFTSLKN